MTGLHGSASASRAAGEGYKAAPEYSKQGNKRKIRDLLFSYIVADEDAAGNTILTTASASRDEEVTIEQIGLAALEKGERNNSFYTDKQLAKLSGSGSDAEPVAGDVDISTLGQQELAEWLATDNPETGRTWTINDVLEKVGDDKDLAQRMLEAENIRGDGDPRDGLQKGLTQIIERA